MDNPSNVIQVIRRMIQEKASDDQILKNLRELGVEENTAKRLLLAGRREEQGGIRTVLTKPEVVIESYTNHVDGVDVEINIIQRPGDFVLEYFVNFPEYGPGTKALLANLKNTIISDATIRTERMLDPKFIQSLKEKFEGRAAKALEQELRVSDEQTKKFLVTTLLHEMLGLGKIEFLLADGNLEEIVVNDAADPVWVYNKKYGWLKTNIFIQPEEEIQNFASIIARRVGKQITTLNPLLDAHLITGDRANATLFPISSKGNTITIRRFRREPWTVTDFIKNKTVNSEIMALIWLAMQYEMNIIVSGGTASGKTSLLNIMLPFIQPNHRIISIEDSVSGESEIVVEQNGKILKTRVGELIDGLAEDDSIKDMVIENDEDIRIPSMSAKGQIEWKEPSHFIRHWVKKDQLKITLKSGKTIEVTPDHSLFSLNNEGKIAAILGQEIKEGTWLATPRVLDWQGQKIVFNLREHLKAFEGCFMRSIEIGPLLQNAKAALQTTFNKQVVNYAIQKGRARVEMLEEIQQIPSAGFIASRLGTQIPLEIEVDEDLACFAGMWLADGSYDKNSIIVSIVEPEARSIIERVAARFGVKTRMHSDGISLMINSKPLKQFCEKVMELKGDAYTKKMPGWVFKLEKPLVAAVLRGYFSGDGWVRKNDIAIRSSSKQLLQDTQTLLLRFGIPLRVKWQLLKDKTYEARISSTIFLSKYMNEIGFNIDRKTKNGEHWLTGRNHDVSDVVPLPKHFYKAIKQVLKTEVGQTRTYKGWKSYNYRTNNIGRSTLQKIVQKYSTHLPLALVELAFNDVQWDPVVSVEKKSFEGFVYDFSVPKNENFICNNVLCHNTRELQLPEFLHWVPMTTREPSSEGKGGVEMLDLLVNSLRMRPDRLIVGEVRRQKEAEVMFEGMHTGHSVYTTFHANTAQETIRRMINPPVNVPSTMLEAVHLNVVMFRNRRLGVRRVLQIAEFVPEKRGNEEFLRANVIYRWKPATDEIGKNTESIRFLDELSLHTGMNQAGVDQELKTKQQILDWMVKNNINNIKQVGRIMAEYYMDEEKVKEWAEKDLKPDFLKEPVGEVRE